VHNIVYEKEQDLLTVILIYFVGELITRSHWISPLEVLVTNLKDAVLLARRGLHYSRIVFDSDAFGKNCSLWFSLPARFSNRCCTCLLTCLFEFKNYLRTTTPNYVLVHLDLCLTCTLSGQYYLLKRLPLDIIPFQQCVIRDQSGILFTSWFARFLYLLAHNSVWFRRNLIRCAIFCFDMFDIKQVEYEMGLFQYPL